MDFKFVPKEYRPIPFWSWNEKLETEETREQIRQMDEAGISGFLCMPEVVCKPHIWAKNGLKMWMLPWMKDTREVCAVGL